jgi:hypothetical protein
MEEEKLAACEHKIIEKGRQADVEINRKLLSFLCSFCFILDIIKIIEAHKEERQNELGRD